MRSKALVAYTLVQQYRFRMLLFCAKLNYSVIEDG